MPLTKCIECNKEISSSAIVCPNCGYNKNAMKRKKIGRIALVLLIMPFTGITLMLISLSNGGISKPLFVLGMLLIVVSLPLSIILALIHIFHTLWRGE